MLWLVRAAVAAAVVFAGPAVVEGSAGAGASEVSGYLVQNVRYISPSSSPDRIVGVSFSLDGPAAVAKVSLERDGGWVDCHKGKGWSWSCPVEGLPIATVDQVRVLATQAG